MYFCFDLPLSLLVKDLSEEELAGTENGYFGKQYLSPYSSIF